MNRQEFIKTCGMACLAGTILPSILQSCSSGRHFTQNEVIDNKLKVSLREFTHNEQGQSLNRTYLIIRSDKLNFPISLYKLSDKEYSAVLMECTHLGVELSAQSDSLTCLMHGSKFSRQRQVIQGPAQKDLRKFKTSHDGLNVYIDLS